MKEHKNLDLAQVSKVTLHFVCGHLLRKQTVMWVKLDFRVMLVFECHFHYKIFWNNKLENSLRSSFSNAKGNPF